MNGLQQRLRLDIEHQHWPLRRPFHITGFTFVSSDVVEVTISDGECAGRGEASGVYYKGETAEKIASVIEAVRTEIEAGIDRHALSKLLPPGGARNVLDCALWDYEAKRNGKPVWQLAGLQQPPRPLLTTFTIGAGDPDEMGETASEYTEARAIKVKLLGDGRDCDRVRSVFARRPDVWLAVDANQGFTPETLDGVWDALLECRVQLIEQPFRVGEEVRIVKEHPIPIAADESAQSSGDVRRLSEFFDVINIKLDKCGGLTEGLELAQEAMRYGLKVMVGNMTGTSLAMAPAFVLGQLCTIVDLDGPIFLSADRNPSVCYRDGMIDVPKGVWGDY